MNKSDFNSIQFDYKKPTLRKTNETLETLKERGYKSIAELSGNETLPSVYYYNEVENRMFSIQMAGVSEVIKMKTRNKRNEPYTTVFEK